MGQERREYRRADLRFVIKYRRAGALMDLWRDGTMTDLSAGGLRFSTEELIDQGVTLEFQILLPIRKDPYVLVGQVVSEAPSEPQRSEYGAAFVDVSPDKQVEVDELVQFLTRRRDEG